MHAPDRFRDQLLATLPRLRRSARFLVPDTGSVDDLVQTTPERTLSHWHQFDQRRDLLQWIWVCASTCWPRWAAVAPAVYAPEVRHPVEVNVANGNATQQRAQEQHLALWLSKRLDLPIRLHDLRPQGFKLIGGRLLPDSSGPSAPLMYPNGNGKRNTLYLRRPEPGTHTDFRFRQDGELNLFYGVEDGFACALVGKLPREQLLALAEAAYKQADTAGLPAAVPLRPGS